MMPRWIVTALFGAVALTVVSLTVGQVSARNSTLSSVTVKTLAQGPVKSLPAGKVYLSVLEFRQLPGVDFGPHSHISAIAYTLHGVDTISFPGASTHSVGTGEAAFIPGFVTHTHENLDGRISSGVIAAGLIVVVILLCAATWLGGTRRRVTIAVLSILLIAGGTWPLLGATANDYYLLTVRPEVQRAGAMPRPDGQVLYAAPDLNPVPAAPYLETLSAITVPAGATYNAPDAPGPEMIVVLDGSAAVQVGGETTQLGGGGGASAQAGQTLSIVNSGSGTLHALDFAVTSNPAT
jgi:hypothetical protein